jgi:hypothetical protein
MFTQPAQRKGNSIRVTVGGLRHEFNDPPKAPFYAIRRAVKAGADPTPSRPPSPVRPKWDKELKRNLYYQTFWFKAERPKRTGKQIPKWRFHPWREEGRFTIDRVVGNRAPNIGVIECDEPTARFMVCALNAHEAKLAREGKRTLAFNAET